MAEPPTRATEGQAAPACGRSAEAPAYSASHFFQLSIGPVTGVVFDW